MPTDDRLCIFDPTTNRIVDLLRRDESEVEALLRLAQHGLDLIVLPLAEAWQRHELAARRRPKMTGPKGQLRTSGTTNAATIGLGRSK